MSLNFQQILEKPRGFFWPARVKEMKRRAWRSLQRLRPVQDHTARIRPGARLLLTMGRDENPRIPHFLEYYRKLGIDHFLFVDNQSSPPMADLLAGQPDVSLWHTDEGYAETRFGVDWMNALLARHAVGHWVLTVDLDEYFVHPFMETRPYGELLSHLDDLDKPSLYALMIDMYPAGPIAAAEVPQGASPLEYAPYFDRAGYYMARGGHGDTWARGGPRLRVFHPDDFTAAPAINKIPLINWRRHFVYYSSTHAAYPARLNRMQRTIHEPTGALLHFKFVSSIREKIDSALRLRNHYEGSREYEKYRERIDDGGGLCLRSPASARYEGSRSLIDCGLMTPGGWS
jgi:hypothetical protein